MFNRLRETLNAYKDRDPAARGSLYILLLYPGVHAAMFHRLAHKLYKARLYSLARFISQFSRFWTGIEIHPGAVIGRRFVIDHGTGVVIGETSEIGDDVILYQGCTLGGTGKDTGKRHPTIGNNVMVGAGAKILGPINIGNNSRIAAGAVVLRDVPNEATAVGVPARVVRIAGSKPVDELDQMGVTDPVSVELASIKEVVERLEKRISELERGKNSADETA